MGASSRLRSLQYLPYLEANGFEVTVQCLFDDGYLQQLYQQGRRSRLNIFRLYLKRLITLMGCYQYDLIWIEKEIFPYFPAFVERLLRLLGKPYVVDYDDAIFHNYDLSDNPLLRKMLGRKIDTVMRHSVCVIAGNTYLAARAREAGAPKVESVPTVVDHSRYSVRSPISSARPVIGWIGSPSTQQYVVGIRDALARACKTHGARVLLVGASPSVVNELPGLDIEVVPWSEESEGEQIRRMDIGIMPLPDGPWEKGKCGYKLIQYMASGVPVIASPVGANIDIVIGNDCGLLAAELEDWTATLNQLLQSPDNRREMGEAGRKAVEKTYSLQVQALVMSRIFNTI